MCLSYLIEDTWFYIQDILEQMTSFWEEIKNNNWNKHSLAFEKLNYPSVGAEAWDLEAGYGEVSSWSAIPIKVLPKLGFLLAKQQFYS